MLSFFNIKYWLWGIRLGISFPKSRPQFPIFTSNYFSLIKFSILNFIYYQKNKGIIINKILIPRPNSHTHQTNTQSNMGIKKQINSAKKNNKLVYKFTLNLFIFQTCLFFPSQVSTQLSVYLYHPTLSITTHDNSLPNSLYLYFFQPEFTIYFLFNSQSFQINTSLL